MKCGRKPTGRVNLGLTITLPPELVKEMDKQRGKVLRSRFIAQALKEKLYSDSDQLSDTTSVPL